MEENIRFQSEVRYDLATYKEFDKINTWTLPSSIFYGILYLVCMTYLLSALEYSFSAKKILIVSLFSLGVVVFSWLRNRDGGIQYKRMLRSNNDQVPHYLITIDENAVTLKNLYSEKETPYSFTDMRCIMESARLLVLVDDLKTAYVIDKTTLTGGSRDALVCFLRKQCPKLKKRIRKGGLGRILWYLMRIFPILMLLASLAVLLHIPEKLSGQIAGNMSYEEIAEELRPLGIEISPEAIQELNQYYEENRLDILSDGTTMALNLLCWEGQGRFEKHVFYQEGPVEAYDWDWTPSTSGVYWFDLEFIEFGDAYTKFLKGISAMDSSLSFTNVAEDYSNASILDGQGKIGFSFDYLGNHHELVAEFNHDWFDGAMLYEVGKILNRDEDPKNLWYFCDGQGVLLYYGTEEEAEALERKTGLIFLDPVKNRLYS